MAFLTFGPGGWVGSGRELGACSELRRAYPLGRTLRLQLPPLADIAEYGPSIAIRLDFFKKPEVFIFT